MGPGKKSVSAGCVQETRESRRCGVAGTSCQQARKGDWARLGVGGVVLEPRFSAKETEAGEVGIGGFGRSQGRPGCPSVHALFRGGGWGILPTLHGSNVLL